MRWAALCLGVFLVVHPHPSAGQDAPNKSDKRAGANGVEFSPDSSTRTVRFPSDLSISNKAIATFQYGSSQYDILVSEAFLKQFAGNAIPTDPTPAQQKMMRNHTFYIPPTVAVTPGTVKKAVDAAQQVEGTELLRATIPVELLPLDVRVEAMNVLNNRYSDAGLRLDNISLIPFEYLEVREGVTDAGTPLLSMPSTVGRQPSKLSAVPNAITFDVYGTRLKLGRFAQNPEFTVRYTFGGVSVKQNLVSLTATAFVQTGLHQFLTGDADWRFRDKAVQQTVQGGGLFGALERIATGRPPEVKRDWSRDVRVESWVSRAQVKSLLQEYHRSASLLVWREFGAEAPDNKLLDQMTTTLADLLLKGNQGKWFDIDQKDFVIDPHLVKNFDPDQLKGLNDEIAARLKTAKKVEAKGEIGGVAKGEAKEENEYDEGVGRKPMAQGEFIVPKRVKLYQINRAAFDGLLTQSFTEIRAQATNGRFEQRNHPTAFARLGNVSTLGGSTGVPFQDKMAVKAETDGFVIVSSGGQIHGPADEIVILADGTAVGRATWRVGTIGYYGIVMGVVRQGQTWSVEMYDGLAANQRKKVTAVRVGSELTITFIPFVMQPIPAPSGVKK